MYSGKNNFNQHNINQKLTQPTINQFTQQEVERTSQQQTSNTSLKNPKNNLDKLRNNLMCTSSKNSTFKSKFANSSSSGYSTQQNPSDGISSQNSKSYSEGRQSDDSELTMGDYKDDDESKEISNSLFFNLLVNSETF